MGSGAGVFETEGIVAMARRIVRPFGFARFSGTTRKPQRAVANAGTGWEVFGQGPDSNLAGGAFFADWLVEELPLFDPEQAADMTATMTRPTVGQAGLRGRAFVLTLPPLARPTTWFGRGA
jgi:hypothetical protein